MWYWNTMAIHRIGTQRAYLVAFDHMRDHSVPHQVKIN
jgi:hypothetical protein